VISPSSTKEESKHENEEQEDSAKAWILPLGKEHYVLFLGNSSTTF